MCEQPAAPSMHVLSLLGPIVLFSIYISYIYILCIYIEMKLAFCFAFSFLILFSSFTLGGCYNKRITEWLVCCWPGRHCPNMCPAQRFRLKQHFGVSVYQILSFVVSFCRQSKYKKLYNFVFCPFLTLVKLCTVKTRVSITRTDAMKSTVNYR